MHGRRARWADPAAGVGFIVVVALLLGTCVAAYQQRFTPVVLVTLRADRAGNMLTDHSDVKLRGLLVGRVREVTSTGQGAVLTLALDPDKVAAIPADVNARLLPKTLFGERYVDLEPPAGAASAASRTARPIREGDTITQDHSQVAIELEQVFDHLLPLLRTVQPEKLAATLNALATALEGRGQRLGQNLVADDAYLRQLNPEMPTIRADISALADVASAYADAAPDLVRLLRSLITPSSTLAQKKDTLAGFLAGTAGFADTATGFLRADGDRIIQVNRVGAPTMQTLARYSPEYPCLAQALTRWTPRITDAFSHHTFHITLEVVSPREPFKPGEEPAWGPAPAGSCGLLPCPPSSQAEPLPSKHFQDGTANLYGYSSDPVGDYKRSHPDWRRQFAELDAHCGQPGYIPPDMTFERPSSGPALSGFPATGLARADSGMAGTAAEQRLVSALLGSRSSDSTITTLLAGPVLRGTSVSQD